MRSWQKILLPALAVCGLSIGAALPSHAAGAWDPSWADGGSGGSGGSHHGAPGPVAGAGLPFLLAAGAYLVVRRYRKRGKAE